jgi:hypothetical protein
VRLQTLRREPTYSYRDYPSRESGRQKCLNCGEELMSWSSARDYSEFKLVEPKNAEIRNGIKASQTTA